MARYYWQDDDLELPILCTSCNDFVFLGDVHWCRGREFPAWIVSIVGHCSRCPLGEGCAHWVQGATQTLYPACFKKIVREETA